MHSHNPVSDIEIFLSPLCVEDECALTGENSSCCFIHSTKWQHREPGLNPLASNRSRHSNVTNSPKRLFHDIYQAVHTAVDHPKIILFLLYHSQQRKETIQVQRVTWRYNQWLQVNELYFTQNDLSPTAETFNTGWNGIFGSRGFSTMWTVNFLFFKLVLEKAEEPEIKLPTSAGSWKKHLLYWVCQSLWLCRSQ